MNTKALSPAELWEAMSSSPQSCTVPTATAESVAAAAPPPAEIDVHDITVDIGKTLEGVDVSKLSRADLEVIIHIVRNETRGDDTGLAYLQWLFGKRKAILSESEVVSIWNSRSEQADAPLTLEYLRGPVSKCQSKQVVETTSQPSKAVHDEGREVLPTGTNRNPLDKYALNGSLAAIERVAVQQRPIFSGLALMGQSTMIYGAPNSGKTSITLALIIEAIKAGDIDPHKFYYINNDDTTTGLAEKLNIAEEYGFRMLAESHQDFDARKLLSILADMADRDVAREVIVLIDTATKVVNVLDAGKTREFTRVVRKFVLKGGTLIALAHANKNPGLDGKPVYRGTTDIINDFDCVHMLTPLKDEDGERTVQFENRKRRGDVVGSAAYTYSTEAGISYLEVLASVQKVEPSKVGAFREVEAQRSDAELVAVVRSLIGEGVNTKMLLADMAAKSANVSKRAAIKIIERYTGNDPAAHHWKFVVRARGAKVFELLTEEATTPLPPSIG